jgi:hypothetical protein
VRPAAKLEEIATVVRTVIAVAAMKAKLRESGRGK